MEQAVNATGATHARRNVIGAIASLSDSEYQLRVWIHQDLPYPDYYDGFDLTINVLFDDHVVLPDPRITGDRVLLAGDEVPRLRELGRSLGSMINRLGDVAESDCDYVTDSHWPQVVERAQRCLPALVLAGGWEYSDTDADLYTKQRAEGRVPTVELPATRRRVIKAVAALADEEYQRRTWTGDNDDAVTGGLEACLHTLTDDTHVLPEPADAIGRVLLAGDEIVRLATLWTALEPFRANPTPERWASTAWQTVVTTALHCLPALVIAGAWIGPNPADSAPGRPDRSHS